MKTLNKRIGTAGVAALGLSLTCASLVAGGPRPRAAIPQSDQQFQQLIRSVEGPDLFRAHCSSCHGSGAKGHGPAAGVLKIKVPDLTVLAKNNAGQFPAAHVRRVIMGDDVVASHGSRQMPVWGPIFHQIEEDVDRGNVRLENLAKYLQSIQTIQTSSKEPGRKVSMTQENLPTGAQLYEQDCASCHGSDLKGTGDFPYPFRAPPDLTTLARRHGGNFPDAHVADVLHNGVKIPAHGPAEMPAWGPDFKSGNRLSAAQVTLRISTLSNYIKSLQAK